MGNVSTGGAWLPDGKLTHINVLEVKAILPAPRSFVKTNHKHIEIMSGNITVIQNRNIKMGASYSIKSHHQEWSMIKKNHLPAAHDPGKLNTVSDKEFRSNHVETECKSQSKFLNLC